jgi:hypothetical protein
LFHLWSDRAHHACCDLILWIENILDGAIEAVGPDVRSSRCIDELSNDAHPVRRLAHAAFKQIADTEFAADLLHMTARPL